VRAVAVSKFGGTPELVDIPQPTAGPGEVLVKLAAAGVNPFDWMLDGKAPHVFPLVLGIDGAGTVAAVGSGVTRFAVGDAVYGQFFHRPVGTGTYAEYVTVPAGQTIAAAPSSVSAAAAAAVPTSGATGLALVEEVGAGPGQRLLIVGATGGVGSFATQLAAARGAHVIATARGNAVGRIRDLGAAETIDHRAGPIADQLPDGVDALIDVVSDASAFAANAALVRPGGVAVTTVFAADPEALAERQVRGVNLNAAPSPETLDLLAAEIDAGRLRIPVGTEVPLAEAPAAVALSRSGRAAGKIVILI
jgi:NADPH:quinone reductase-like Zn-dependent oxidoreductase